MSNNEEKLQREYSGGGQRQVAHESSSFSINAIGPDLSIPGQHEGGQNTGGYQGHQQDTHPALFGQNQPKDGLGPVYAIPSFPPPYSQSQKTTGQQQDTHPALFDQYQLTDGIGPVYAIPSFPPHYNYGQGMEGAQWHHGHGHSEGTTQGQQWCRCSHPQPMMPQYMQPPFGHQHYH